MVISLIADVFSMLVLSRVVVACLVVDVSVAVDIDVGVVIVAATDGEAIGEFWTPAVTVVPSRVIVALLELVLVASLVISVIGAVVFIVLGTNVAVTVSVVLVIGSVVAPSAIVVLVKTPIDVVGISVSGVDGAIVVSSVLIGGAIVISGVVEELCDSVLAGSEKHFIVCTCNDVVLEVMKTETYAFEIVVFSCGKFRYTSICVVI